MYEWVLIFMVGEAQPAQIEVANKEICLKLFQTMERQSWASGNKKGKQGVCLNRKTGEIIPVKREE